MEIGLTKNEFFYSAVNSGFAILASTARVLIPDIYYLILQC